MLLLMPEGNQNRGIRSRLKMALLIEFPVIRNILLRNQTDQIASVHNCQNIVQASVITPDCPAEAGKALPLPVPEAAAAGTNLHMYNR